MLPLPLPPSHVFPPSKDTVMSATTTPTGEVGREVVEAAGEGGGTQSRVEGDEALTTPCPTRTPPPAPTNAGNVNLHSTWEKEAAAAAAADATTPPAPLWRVSCKAITPPPLQAPAPGEGGDRE